MARILFLTELLPYPLVSGAKIRAYYVLRHLAQHHEVTLLSFVRDSDRADDVAHLAGFLERVHTVPMQRSRLRDARAVLESLATGRPAIIAREQIGAMRNQVEKLLAVGGFDAVHADQIPMAQYGLLGRNTGARCLLDEHNATFQLLERVARQQSSRWKRLAVQREASAFARYERQVCRAFDHVVFVTDEDRQTLLGAASAAAEDGHNSVIPICVDTGAVQPVAPAGASSRVTFVGTMYWPPNVEGFTWFYRQVWPIVRAKVPAARLTCIGRSPPRSILAWDGLPDVEILGYVPDLEPYLAETAAWIVPLHAAGGMRVKILDAWCWGVPVVSTSIGAEGIEWQQGDSILVADSPDAFADAVVRLLSDASVRGRMRELGRRWVEEHYDWRPVYRAWDEVYGRLLVASGAVS